VWSPAKGTGLHDAAVLLTTVKSFVKEDSLLEEIQIPFLDEKNCLFCYKNSPVSCQRSKKKLFIVVIDVRRKLAKVITFSPV